LPLVTASGVFGAQRVDHGTLVLLRNAPRPPVCASAVDIGAGYGPIAVAMGLRQPSAGIWAVDVNRRALSLSRRNAAAIGVGNLVTAEPQEVPSALRFDRLYSNPPIKTGRDGLHELLAGWLARLAPGGDAYLVVKQAMGADALHRWLNEVGHPTTRAASKQGYRLLHVGPAPMKPQSPAGLTHADLKAVNRETGRRWCVLGRLAGGMADSVQLLRSGDARAVVKIKNGQWWGGQLERTAVTTDALRAAGYPTPAVLGFGNLGEDRFYLATEFAAGSQPAGLDPVVAREVLAAVDLHAGVHPPHIRDWSAMITLFLNGGITEHRFPAQLASLAQRALDLVSHPVPALPSGNFVHGDFSTRNLLTVDRRLSAVIDVEGFGRGTRTIDLVALLDSGISRPEDRTTTNLIVEAAIAASDEQTFRACLAHRVLASLITTPERPRRLAAAAERARALLALAG
jgi:precorrin-6B methylase 2